MRASLLLILSGSLLGLSASLCALVFAETLRRARSVGTYGRRRDIRERARRSLFFRGAEPLILVAGECIALLRATPFLKRSAHALAEKTRARLLIAGLPWGLTPEEFVGSSSLLAVFLGVLGRYGTVSHASGAFGLGLGALVGIVGPIARLDALYAARAKDAMRDIPRTMDLAGLCMNAGMDFSAALRTVAEMDRGTVAVELGLVLRSLELGMTRRVALFALMERLPCTEVRDFCRAVAQADEKGTSLALALSQQARLCRMKRSWKAEENAARAAVLLIGPMMLLLVALLLVLVGPLLIGGIGL